jgi:hypothetical protein
MGYLRDRSEVTGAGEPAGKIVKPWVACLLRCLTYAAVQTRSDHGRDYDEMTCTVR